MLFLTFLFLMMGASVASFLNVCADRLPLGKSIIEPPSHCDNCNHRLGILDLIPIFSYIFLRGKCRYCSDKLPLYLFFGEIYLGVVFASFFRIYYFHFFLFLYMILASILYLISIMDFKTQEIPEILLWLVAIIGIIHQIIIKFYFNVPIMIMLKETAFSILIGGGIFLIIFLLSRGGMGDGDVILIATLGLFTNRYEMLLLIFLSFVSGALISLFLLAFKFKSRKDAIAFGPFIIFSFFIVKLLGQDIIYTYLKLLQ